MLKRTLTSIFISVLFCQTAFCDPIEGNVTDTSGSPVPSVTVRAYDFGTGNYKGTATTNANGKYTITNLSAGTYKIHFLNQQGYLEQYYNNTTDWYQADPVNTVNGQPTTGIDFTVLQGGNITGTVTDKLNGTPLQDIWVQVYNSDNGSYIKYASTDANGNYTLQGLQNGNYKVYLNTQMGYVRQYYDNVFDWNQALPLSIAPETTTSGIDFQLVKGSTISGTVTKLSDASPIADIIVYLYDYQTNGHISSDHTDQNGNYTIEGIPAGNYYLRTYSYGDLIGQYYDNAPFKNQAEQIAISQDQNLTGFDFQLYEGGKISGTVTDSSTGLPVANARIEVSDFSDIHHASAYTDASGNYLISGLNAGTYMVSFNEPDYVFQFYPDKSHHNRLQADPVPVTPGETTSGIDFSAIRGGSISGTVLGPDGEPVENAFVSVHDYYANRDHINGAWTNANGEYTVSQMPTGSFEVRADSWSTGYPEQYYDHTRHWNDATPVVVGFDQDVFGINFDLEPGATITGTVTAPDGTPVSNTRVQCFGNNIWFDDCYSDQNGQYTITGIIPENNWRIAAYPPAGSGHMITVTDRFIPAGTTNGFDIQLDPNGFTISGTVTDKATGLPVPNIYVGCHIADDPYDFWGGDCPTDENGRYELNGLPSCEIIVWVEVRNHPQYAGTGTEVWLEDDLTLDFQLPAPSSVSGYVIDMDTGQPVENVVVEIWNDQSETGDRTTTNSNGYFIATGLSPGISEVIAMPHTSSGYAWSMPCPDNWIDIPEGVDFENRYIAIQKGALVTGRFVAGDGTTPIAHTEYDVSSDWTELWGTPTGANGEFEFRLPLGNYGIALEIDDEDHSNHFQTVNIADLNTQVSLGDIKIYDQTDGGQISGTFLNSAGFDFPGEIEALALKAGTNITPQNWASYWDTRWDEISPAGDYTIKSLPPGNYDIYLLNFIESTSGSETGVARDIVYDVPVGTTGIVLEFDSQGGTVTGLIENAYGEVIVGCCIILTDQATGKFAAFTEGTPNRIYSINNVEPGTYTLTTVHRLYQPLTRTVTVTEGAVTTVDPITLNFAGIRQGPDIDGNGEVNLADLADFAGQWLGSGPDADFDNDGTVGLADLNVIARMWMSKAIWRN